MATTWSKENISYDLFMTKKEYRVAQFFVIVRAMGPAVEFPVDTCFYFPESHLSKSDKNVLSCVAIHKKCYSTICSDT